VENAARRRIYGGPCGPRGTIHEARLEVWLEALPESFGGKGGKLPAPGMGPILDELKTGRAEKTQAEKKPWPA